jgi:RimJ/RimL family protein N-acetyltransferase
MTWLAPVALVGDIATLEPLSPEHHDGLVEAVKDGELWNLWYTTIPQPKDMRNFIEKRMGLDAPDTRLGFVAVENCSKKIVGMTNYMNADRDNRRLEIGGTWYSRRVQRSELNTECKLLLLAHAFETLGCIAVEFRTHFFNHQSRRAIERLGAKLDGILRNHQASADGVLRDTCVYSIIAGEWPTVRTHLRWQLKKPRIVGNAGA